MQTIFSESEKKDFAAQMHAAVEALDVAKAQALLASGVPPDVWGITEDLDLPLQAVARRKGTDALTIARALIESGADIDFQGDYDCTALARSVEKEGPDGDDWRMARYLVGAGANPSLYDRDGLTPSECANSNGYDDAILAMLDAGMDPHSGGISGPLIWYMSYDAPDVIRALLARGADPNAAAYGIACNGQTPLHRAAESFANGAMHEDAFLSISIQLIQAGADPAQIDPAPDCLAAFLLARQERAAFEDLLAGIAGARSGRPRAR